MSIILSSTHSALRQSVSATVEALFGVCNEIRPSDAEFNLAASVAITGDATARVIVRVDDVISRRYASEMFELPESDLSDVDITDALLELTNVLGGAAKTAVEGECVLALPSIVDLAEQPASEDEAAFEISGGTLSVSIVGSGS